jgi:hypothetical protein
MPDELVSPKLGRHGGPRTKGIRSPQPIPKGVRRDYVLARLERDGRHGLAAVIRAGRVSAHTIAVELGWIKRPAVLGGSPNAALRREAVVHALRREGVLPGATADLRGLDPAELMELTIGPGQMGSVFRTHAEVRSAWEMARDELLQRARPGRRPAAWWVFDAGDLQYPSYDLERSTLWRAGVLSEAERAALETEWREEFDRAQAPDFMIARAWPEDLLEGPAARDAHCAWADIPAELVEAWSEKAGPTNKKAPPG